MPEGAVAEVCEDATIYMTPSNPILPMGTRSEWHMLLQRALASKASDRWQALSEMADAVRNAKESAPVCGHVEVHYPLGDRPKLVRDDEGAMSAAWVFLAPEDARFGIDDW